MEWLSLLLLLLVLFIPFLLGGTQYITSFLFSSLGWFSWDSDPLRNSLLIYVLWVLSFYKFVMCLLSLPCSLPMAAPPLAFLVEFLHFLWWSSNLWSRWLLTVKWNNYCSERSIFTSASFINSPSKRYFVGSLFKEYPLDTFLLFYLRSQIIEIDRKKR